MTRRDTIATEILKSIVSSLLAARGPGGLALIEGEAESLARQTARLAEKLDNALPPETPSLPTVGGTVKYEAWNGYARMTAAPTLHEFEALQAAEKREQEEREAKTRREAANRALEREKRQGREDGKVFVGDRALAVHAAEGTLRHQLGSFVIADFRDTTSGRVAVLERGPWTEMTVPVENVFPDTERGYHQAITLLRNLDYPKTIVHPDVYAIIENDLLVEVYPMRDCGAELCRTDCRRLLPGHAHQPPPARFRKDLTVVVHSKRVFATLLAATQEADRINAERAKCTLPKGLASRPPEDVKVIPTGDSPTVGDGKSPLEAVAKTIAILDDIQQAVVGGLSPAASYRDEAAAATVAEAGQEMFAVGAKAFVITSRYNDKPAIDEATIEITPERIDGVYRLRRLRDGIKIVRNAREMYSSRAAAAQAIESRPK